MIMSAEKTGKHDKKFLPISVEIIHTTNTHASVARKRFGLHLMPRGKDHLNSSTSMRRRRVRINEHQKCLP
jgi:hypothetical protein